MPADLFASPKEELGEDDMDSCLWRVGEREVGWRRGEKRRPRRKWLGKISIDSLESHLGWTLIRKEEFLAVKDPTI